MPLSCRQRLVALARKHDALIITDDIYDCLQFGSARPEPSPRPTAVLPRLVDIDRSLPPLASDPDRFGHTASNGSFSKIIAPGLRTGWIDASPALARAVAHCGATCAGGCPSQLCAAIVGQFLRHGALRGHLSDTLIPAFRRRRALMVDAIATHLGPLGAELSGRESEPMVGGYFLWIRLPDGVPSRNVATVGAQHENLTVSPGSTFGIPGDGRAPFDDHVRVCFAWEDEADLVEGVARLGRVIQRIQILERSQSG